jgi:hypothetical protein
MKKIALVVFLLAAAAVALWHQPPIGGSADALETWVKGRGAGHEIKLLRSGRYESSAFCDICAASAKVGRWRRSGSELVLIPQQGGPVTLSLVTFRGCRALVVKGAPAPRFPTEVFFPASESCGDAL